MKGLELAERYWNEVGAPALEAACPEAFGALAVGLVGEGSECLGYDDGISRDHDWGPGFCVWLTREGMERFGPALQRAYQSLPPEFLGWRRLRESEMSAGRVGVFEIGAFYQRFLGRREPPKDEVQWFALPDQALNVCTNGKVFLDREGAFTAFREVLLGYYPEDVRRKKLAAQCALAAQSGQYNYVRCLRRGERVAAMQALAAFIDHAQAAIFLLDRRYRPYYKWAHRALGEGSALARAAAARMTRMAEGDPGAQEEEIEALSADIIQGLKEQGLTGSGSDFLLDHAQEIQRGIRSPVLRGLPLMAG
ncbi:DUF4037 domain-containing protein [uncultured Intestinimonas sp.]|uniref:DUF4037 domain-containing protein n=1 Tax=uncultured Intestinimonas sp. TaxID=1689265 RepID=UPI0025EE8C85|nr:DUF4037 domain-containing protein [uncultured Intestinimonas sp.]